MGNAECCISHNFAEQLKQLEIEQKFPNESNPLPLVITYDDSHTYHESYDHQPRNNFCKIEYDWACIPIMTQINGSASSFFQVQSQKIEDDNLVIGIISKDALNQPMPWRSPDCICYQSHFLDGQSGVISNGIITHSGRSLQKDKSIKVIIINWKIQWRIEGELQAVIQLGQQWRNKAILPYICLFHPGDTIRIKQ